MEGIQDARQYTIPIEEALNRVRSGEMPELTARQKHLRECFVVAKEGADLKKIEDEIKNMPDYFRDYDTIVHFISQEELDRTMAGFPTEELLFTAERPVFTMRTPMLWSTA